MDIGDDRFDFIVVGAGSAGCVLAARLSERAEHRVLLLEAGPPDSNPWIRVPAAVPALIGHPVLDWRYRTVPQVHAANRQIPLPRGRTLGGSSSINGMVYSRGHPLDYDRWAADGNVGWSHREVLPYFRRSERNLHRDDPRWHGNDGPMHVSSLATINPVTRRFLEASRSFGLPDCDDFNAGATEGVGPRQATILRGRRVSSATAFLAPARGRRNLVVLTGAEIDRVVVEGRRATGVCYRMEGDPAPRTARAEREVVLSAGTFGSPCILLRSGIGDGAHLAALGIATTHHLPGVGCNLQDHISAAIQHVTRSTEPYGASARAWPKLAMHVLDYVVRRRGVLAGNVFEAAGFVRTDPALERPDIQLVFMPVHRSATGQRVPTEHGFGLISVLLQPGSRGTVRLASPEPSTMPLIDPAFFDDPNDLSTLLRGVRLARAILAAPAFAPLRSRERLPGDTVQTDDDLADFVRRHATTTYHPVGTCRMGNDAMAVVDASLCVRGVSGLRVVDASIMPSVPGGNTHAPVVMIAEKAVDLILGRPPLPSDDEAARAG